jgi:phosphatidylserine decarboxylase
LNYVPTVGPFCREAYPFGLPPLIVGIAAGWAGWTIPALVFVGMATFVFWFFRNPDRLGPEDPLAVWSPADGRVVGFGIVAQPDMPGGQALRIGIFLSLINVHVSWSPIAGRVSRTAYVPGKYLNAMNDKSATENERKLVVLESKSGQRVELMLVAGLVARRIVCPLEEGDHLKRGEKIGLIRFGSRVEILLPAESDLMVQPGDFVAGARTVLARLPANGLANR